MKPDNRVKVNLWKEWASIFVISAALAAVVWHAASWNKGGIYTEMFGWGGSDKAYLVILYNLGLMLGSGALLGVLLGKLAGLGNRKIGKMESANKNVEKKRL